MTERIAHICSRIPKARVFADVGCDHGYMAAYALRKGLCELAYISDVSEGSLSKAKRLLSREIAAGRCVPVVADGMKGLPAVDCVLVAGLGGEEIVKILSEGYLPERFLLQPMRNSDKVRRFLVERGAHIEWDYTFSEGRERRRYYDLILGRNAGGDVYSEKEFRYGRDNLNGNFPTPFLFEMREEREKLLSRLSRAGLSERSRNALNIRLQDTENIIHEVEGSL